METNRECKVQYWDNNGSLELPYKEWHQTSLEDISVEEQQKHHDDGKYDAHILNSTKRNLIKKLNVSY